ncbi:MAG: outer membrane lipoprotein carrier protein LolA [Deltaproteobacteria bacterium]|jgi:outer membrane lipoprotein-sorting protein|nr:outer membrane lipoprotein carrier protein LolA [Deltaproteobacteria bacterium]
MISKSSLTRHERALSRQKTLGGDVGLSSLLTFALVCLVVFLSFGDCFGAQNPGAETILKGLSTRYQGLSGLSAAYSRQTETPLAQDVFQNPGGPAAAGRLAWRKPAYLRLDQATPANEVLTTDGSTVYWYLPAEKLVHVYRRLDLAGEMAPLLSFLTNLNELKKNFRIKKAPATKSRAGQLGLILDPKRKDAATGRIVAYCDEVFQLTGFDLVAVTGEKTSFFLTEVQTAPIETQLFDFVIPKGVRVVEETAK